MMKMNDKRIHIIFNYTKLLQIPILRLSRNFTTSVYKYIITADNSILVAGYLK